jgi:predicted nuclease of predicted toxin-antitoxin system
MKFLVDAHLPYSLAQFLSRRNCDTIHTDDLPEKDKTHDNEIRAIAKRDERIVITKDSDFLHSHLVVRSPEYLLLVTTGNISNRNLLSLFEKHFDEIQKLFETNRCVELSNTEINVHS